MAGSIQTFSDLDALARHLRERLKEKKSILLFAYNGTGKTRLSMAFKDLGKKDESRDTLYFNAFTEDLFTWDNDLENDRERVLRMNTASRFFNGLAELEMESRIRNFLHRYADFNFDIDYEAGHIRFWRETQENAEGEVEPILIKISRGEENIFIWCFFLAVAQLAIDGQDAYNWVQYIYIDDPISSLDENNAIAVAAHLAQMIKRPGSGQGGDLIPSYSVLQRGAQRDEKCAGLFSEQGTRRLPPARYQQHAPLLSRGHAKGAARGGEVRETIHLSLQYSAQHHGKDRDFPRLQQFR